MRYDEGPPRAAPNRFPFRDHGTLADVWGITPAPVAPPPPKPRYVPVERDLDQMSAECAFERFMRGQ